MLAPLLAALVLAHPAVPRQALLVPGKSLAGVRLGDTQASVERRFGASRACATCSQAVSIYRRADGVPALAVAYRRGHVSAVTTLGGQIGWRTPEGLIVGQGIDRIREVYGTLTWRLCVGYSALSMRRASSVTTIYTTGDVVYGFGLSLPGEPVCR
jgi:hypothetical protein